MRKQTNLNIRFFTIITSSIFTCLQFSHAEEVSTITPQSVSALDGKVRLQFESKIHAAGALASSKDQILAPSENVRLKLRMSRNINDFESLNKALEQAEIVDNREALSAESQIADEAITSKGGIIIEGDRMQVHMGRTMSAIGNASLTKENQTITGDRIEYDTQNTTLHVVGNAVINGPDSIAKGTELHLNIDDIQGEMKQASYLMFQNLKKAPPITAFGSNQAQNTQSAQDALTGIYDPLIGMTENDVNPSLAKETTLKEKISADKKPSSRGTAETMFFEGENKKRFSNATFTSCEVGKDDWYIKSNDIKVDTEAKTIQASNARIVFKNVPVLYSPSVSFPYAGQRKTGFLSPLWGQTSRSGFEIYAPYYINIAPNLDATIASRLLTKRGLQFQGEIRYLEENFSGMANIEYLPNDAMTDQSRHFMRFSHQHKFGAGWTGGYQFEKVSDDLYFSELSTRVTSTSRLNLPQQANIAYSDDIWQFNIMAQQYQTLISPLLTDSEKVTAYSRLPYKRLPQVVLNGKKDWGDFIGEIKNQAVYFDLDESKNPISSSTGNLTRPTGARFSSYPSISFPMAKPYGYITPKIGVHYTQYNLNTLGERFDGNPYEESINRSLPIFSLDSGLTFERKTKVMTRPYTQTLEPRIFYVYIPYKDQSLIPRFDTGLADLNLSTLFAENQFSGVDRVNNANQVSLALSTRMIDGESGQQRFAATVGQRFYFTDRKVGLVGNEAKQTDLKSDIVLAATAKLRNNWNVDTAFQYNTSESSLYRSNITARYQPEPGKVLNLTYRYLNDLNTANSNIDQINISTQWPLGQGWYALGRWNYSIKDKNILEGLAGLEYDAGCWQSRFVMQRLYTATAEANYAFFYQLEFGGMASLGASPFRILSRNIPGYKSTSQIPENYRQDAYE